MNSRLFGLVDHVVLKSRRRRFAARGMVARQPFAVAVGIAVLAFSFTAAAANESRQRHSSASNPTSIRLAADGGTRRHQARPAANWNGNRRFTQPEYLGKRYPERHHRGFILIGNNDREPGVAGNRRFFAKIREALDLIADRAPFYFSLMRSINEGGDRVFFYTGRIGPASFNAWDGAYIVRISATHLDPRPVFDNNPYYLAATLVHEMIGHGRQAEDGRLWALYDWCGNDARRIPGVIQVTNRLGTSSGLVEYEANLFARGFLEAIQNEFPDYIERVIKRYLRINKFLERRFPGWYDDDKPTWVMLKEFEGRFRHLCPGLAYTPPAMPPD